MLCRFNVTILVLCLCNCSQYYFGYYMFTVALHRPFPPKSPWKHYMKWKGGGWIKRPSRGSVCFHMLFLFVEAFPFLISHHCQWSPYALGTGKLFDLEGGLWSCICKKLILQSYSCFIEVCSGGKLLLKLKFLLSFCTNLETKKRNAIQLSRHKVWYAH